MRVTGSVRVSRRMPTWATEARTAEARPTSAAGSKTPVPETPRDALAQPGSLDDRDEERHRLVEQHGVGEPKARDRVEVAGHGRDAGEAAHEVAGEVVGVEGVAALPREPGQEEDEHDEVAEEHDRRVRQLAGGDTDRGRHRGEEERGGDHVERPEAEVGGPFRGRRGHEAERYWK
jgi:hypothetical protein